jgi:hypothetical protein
MSQGRPRAACADFRISEPFQELDFLAIAPQC